MLKVNTVFICGVCGKEHKSTIETPDGWGINEEIWVENCFCPEHKIIADFKKQCGGCCQSFFNCALFKSFHYIGSSELSLSKDDFEKIEAGVCPKRSNGTFGFCGGQLKDIDLSEKASQESGLALSKAIREYVKKYKKINEEK